MLKSFLKQYLELPSKRTNVVCLGGGVGTAQILKGLRTYQLNLTAVVSMADDGGSAGRVRRAFLVPPTGDIINCLAALSSEESILKDLFLYRFAGARYAKDTDIQGQKLGNLIFVALSDIYRGDTNRALEEFSKIISTSGRVLPATLGDVNIWAETKGGKKIFGEQNIDLGKYNGSKALKKVHLDPPNIKAYTPTLKALKDADIIIAGPGDLFSTVLPVIIVPEIKKEIQKSKAKKAFIINIANKPFETVNFKASDYIKTVNSHLGGAFFDTILVNTNQKPKIPKIFNYKYVKNDNQNLQPFKGIIKRGNLINTKYPLYHDSIKVAKFLNSHIL